MSTSKSRLYVEGESRSVDDLAKTYAKLENVPAWTTRPPEAEERSPADPLGLNKKRKPSPDVFAEAKEAAVRITKFIALCASELELPAEQTIFAVELTALNTLNAQDCPVSSARINEIRQEAFSYYSASLSKLPDIK
jgi:hypothetical protein